MAPGKCLCFPKNWEGNWYGITVKDLKGKGMTGLSYQLSNIMINTKISCVAEEGIIDGLVKGSDPKSQRKKVPTLTMTLNPGDRQGGAVTHPLP